MKPETIKQITELADNFDFKIVYIDGHFYGIRYRDEPVVRDNFENAHWLPLLTLRAIDGINKNCYSAFDYVIECLSDTIEVSHGGHSDKVYSIDGKNPPDQARLQAVIWYLNNIAQS